VLEGLPEARRLFAELLEVEPAEVVVGGNSSLALMHDIVVQALLAATVLTALTLLLPGPAA